MDHRIVTHSSSNVPTTPLEHSPRAPASEIGDATARDLVGRRFLVTGANTGVGRATAVGLSDRGAEVIVACRSPERAAGVLAEIESAGRGRATLVELDLADLDSVSRAAAAIAREAPRLDAVILNAAVAGARGVTRQGFELAFGVNYLGHFALMQYILPTLGEGARVVHLGSGSHRTAPRPDLDAVRQRTPSLTGIREYATSKLCVMLFHHALTRRLEARRTLSCVADPGDVASEAWRHVPWPVRAWITRGMKAPTDGAIAPLWCATDAQARAGGCYTAEGEDTPSALARDAALAEELWARSEAWVA